MEDNKKIKINLKSLLIIFVILLIIIGGSIYYYYNYFVNVNSNNELKDNGQVAITEYTYEMLDVKDPYELPHGYRLELYNGKFYMDIDYERLFSIFGTYEEKNGMIICNIQTWHSGNEADYAYYSNSNATGNIQLKKVNDTILEIESFSEIKGEIIELDKNGNEVSKGFKKLTFDWKKGNQFELKETTSFKIGEYRIENHDEKIVFNNDYTFDLYLGGEDRIAGTYLPLTNEVTHIYLEKFYGKYANEEYGYVQAILNKINDSTLEVNMDFYTKIIKEGEITRAVEIYESEFLPFEDGAILIKE